MDTVTYALIVAVAGLIIWNALLTWRLNAMQRHLGELDKRGDAHARHLKAHDEHIDLLRTPQLRRASVRKLH